MLWCMGVCVQPIQPYPNPIRVGLIQASRSYFTFCWLPSPHSFTSHYFILHISLLKGNKQKPLTTFPLTPSLGRPAQSWVLEKFPLKSGQKDSWLAKLSTNHQYYQSPVSLSPFTTHCCSNQSQSSVLHLVIFDGNRSRPDNVWIVPTEISVY